MCLQCDVRVVGGIYLTVVVIVVCFVAPVILSLVCTRGSRLNKYFIIIIIYYHSLSASAPFLTNWESMQCLCLQCMLSLLTRTLQLLSEPATKVVLPL